MGSGDDEDIMVGKVGNIEVQPAGLTKLRTTPFPSSAAARQPGTAPGDEFVHRQAPSSGAGEID
jgi:hypothetical protein